MSRKVILSLVMSLLNVPSTSLLSVFSPSTTSPTPLTDSLAIWSIRLQTQVMSTSSASMSAASTHQSTFRPETWVFPEVNDATIAASEDLNLPRHPVTSSSSQHSAASTVPTLLNIGSLGTSLTKVSADYDSVACLTSIKETCADMDRETVVSILFESVSKEKRDRDQNVVQTL